MGLDELVPGEESPTSFANSEETMRILEHKAGELGTYLYDKWLGRFHTNTTAPWWVKDQYQNRKVSESDTER